MKRTGRLLLLLTLIALAGSILALNSLRASTPVEARIVQGNLPILGFDRVNSALTLTFPADHGPHENYQTEWWYFTGNLAAEDGRHFGYQLTFFRRGLIPPAITAQRDSGWAADQVYMAHFALTDVEGRRYTAEERMARGAADLAGASGVPFEVWLENWRIEQAADNAYNLLAEMGDITLEVRLTDTQGPVLHGESGYSRKGPEPGNASMYYSLTRLGSSGALRIGDHRYVVEGLSWMDHEFSTSALASDQVGWDWFALQLSDGTDLMVFYLRRSDGSIDPYSSGTLIDSSGASRHLTREDYAITVHDHWIRPTSGAVYPSHWTVEVPSAELSLEIIPYLANQELNVSFTYWEGAVTISGLHGGRQVTGSGYVELTGYAGSMAGEF